MNTLDSKRVSVIINTCNRGAYLGDTLEALKQQSYRNFEVIVVNGPSTDNTEKVAKGYNIRYFEAPYNISISRNIGIKNAAGEVLAFIDDDAVPEPDWLQDIVNGYDKNPGAGAIGGFVYNHTGVDFQYCYGAITKWGKPVLNFEHPFNHNTAKGDIYNINLGTNMSFLRKAIIDIGGFDEEYEYYHDESDVCVRLINAGYSVVQLSNAYVHHKMAPSSKRDNKKQITNWDSVAKNGIYFSLKYTKGNTSLLPRLIKPAINELERFKSVAKLFLRGGYSPYDYTIRNLSLVRSIYRGYRRGLSNKRKLMINYKYDSTSFVKYIESHNEQKKYVFVSQNYPPFKTDGIARYNNTLAKALSKKGHIIFVVTLSPNNEQRVEYRDKHWIHYYSLSHKVAKKSGFTRLDNVVNQTINAHFTAKSISRKFMIDGILAPLWDLEGLAFLENKLAPTAITLMSPLKKVVETQWSSVKDPSIGAMYELEKYAIENADGVMAISAAIKKTIENDYRVDFKHIKGRWEVLPLGVDPSFLPVKNEKTNNVNKITDSLEILFVGRFEKRKGIDLLLNSLASILPDNNNILVRLVGDSEIKDENGKSIFSEFKKKYSKMSWFKQIKVHGYVSDQELEKYYKSCDIFVAPSRYESFGLIFIEAMANSKPVIGPNVGGVPEIVIDDVNGLLFDAENERSLSESLRKLIVNKELRIKMGQAGYDILAKKFSAEMMADNFLEFMDKLEQYS